MDSLDLSHLATIYHLFTTQKMNMKTNQKVLKNSSKRKTKKKSLLKMTKNQAKMKKRKMMKGKKPSKKKRKKKKKNPRVTRDLSSANFSLTQTTALDLRDG